MDGSTDRNARTEVSEIPPTIHRNEDVVRLDIHVYEVVFVEVIEGGDDSVSTRNETIRGEPLDRRGEGATELWHHENTNRLPLPSSALADLHVTDVHRSDGLLVRHVQGAELQFFTDTQFVCCVQVVGILDNERRR